VNGPGPQIIGRTSDEVDVPNTKDWQLLLCQITRLGYWTRSRLDRTRDAAWENDIRELLDDNGRIRG
jgi:hypothetical protein